MRVKTQLLVTVLAVLVLGTGVAAAQDGSSGVEGIIQFLQELIAFLKEFSQLEFPSFSLME